MQSLYILLWKTWKNNKKTVIKIKCEEIDTQNGRNNQQQISKGYTHHILLVSTRNPLKTHQGMFWAIFWQKRTKQWFFRPDLKIWRAGNKADLISLLEICPSFQLMHHWQTTWYFRRRKINSDCDHKSSFFGYFHFTNHS